jgi:hypothetical protein
VTRATVKPQEHALIDARDDLARKLAANPRFKEGPRSGQGFVIGVNRMDLPPTPKPPEQR